VHGCQPFPPIQIEVLDSPTLAVSLSGRLSCSGIAYTATAQSNGTVAWQWPDGFTETGNQSTHTLAQAGTLVATATNGFCTTTTASLLPEKVFNWANLPNVFTPNGDGKNDVFPLPQAEAEFCGSLQIINRWGQLVWSGTEGQTWPGTSNKEAVSEGTYFYVVTLQNGQKIKGSVLLLR
jgi:gliding motility-associated-like protein